MPRRPLEIHILRRKDQEQQRYPTQYEMVLQTYVMPLNDFVAVSPQFDPSTLKSIRLVFDLVAEHTTFDAADFRSTLPRFAPEAMKLNRPLVELIGRIAAQKNATRARSCGAPIIRNLQRKLGSLIASPALSSMDQDILCRSRLTAKVMSIVRSGTRQKSSLPACSETSVVLSACT